MTFGERIRTRREQLGMSQEELAFQIGLKSRSAINKIEKGVNSASQSTIMKLASALKTTPAFLMGWADETKVSEPLTIAAHHDGDDWTEAELEDIEMFKELLRKRREKR